MTYRDRREARAERLRGWAEKREAKAEAAEAKTRQISDMIPLGQPILVGHHSEGRHRRDLERINNGWRASIENGRKAEDMRSRADNIEAAAERAIYSDDPDAIERLTERLTELEAERDRIKAYNATCRKGAPDPDVLDDAQRRELATITRVTAYNLGKKGEFPAYVLSNLGGNITRQRKRLAQLKGEA